MQMKVSSAFCKIQDGAVLFRSFSYNNRLSASITSITINPQRRQRRVPRWWQWWHCYALVAVAPCRIQARSPPLSASPTILTKSLHSSYSYTSSYDSPFFDASNIADDALGPPSRRHHHPPVRLRSYSNKDWVLLSLRGGEGTLASQKNINNLKTQHSIKRFFSNQRDKNSAETKVDKEQPAPPTPTKTPTSPSKGIRWWRQGLGSAVSAIGFVSSSVGALVRNPRRAWTTSQQSLRELEDFLKHSGLDEEFEQALLSSSSTSTSTASSKKSSSGGGILPLAILGQIHQALYFANPTFSSSSTKFTGSDPTLAKDSKFWEEAERYMRYSTAVYGQSMIQAAQLDVKGQLDGSLGEETLESIATHIQIPKKDIVLLEVDYDFGPNTDDHKEFLRHFVTIDHEHQSIVLAVRGTFSLQEVVVDLASFSREGFCGGEAHDGMAEMAERLWKVAGPRVCQLLDEHPKYELILTGHSLGAGTACLLTALLSSKQTPKYILRLPKSTKLRCFAYASPPVFTPLQVIPQATAVTTNFIHETDVVPSLSIYSVRELLSRLQSIGTYFNEGTRTWKWHEKVSLASGHAHVPKDLLELVKEPAMLEPKTRAPPLLVPAGRTILLKGNDHDGYRYDVIDKKGHSTSKPFSIRLHPNMFTDHFPQRYEYALRHLSHHQQECQTR